MNIPFPNSINESFSSFAAFLLVVILLTSPSFADPAGFCVHASFTGIGACLRQTFGPGPSPGTERVYRSYHYAGNTLDIVAVDPLTGDTDVFTGKESGSWSIVIGSDGQCYIAPGTRLYRLDWSQRKLIDLGVWTDTEQVIWQTIVGPDKKIYGCTWPHAKLLRYDPATDRKEDLGRMDPHEEYTRYLATDQKDFVYVGIGTANRHLVAYEVSTGEHRDILPPQFAGPGTCLPWLGVNGKVYAAAGSQHFELDGWKATPITRDQISGDPGFKLADGRNVKCDDREVTVWDTSTGKVQSKPITYRGKPQDVFRIGLGPDGRLYGSTFVPIHFFWADPKSDHWEELGQTGSGEIYTFLAYKNAVIAGAYSNEAPLMVYRPGKPYKPGPTSKDNPWMVHYEGERLDWRPMAMIKGPDEKIYIGAVSGYGLLGGPLCIFDPATGKVDQYMHLVKDQSVVALAALPNGLIVGGTMIHGGIGINPTENEAVLFLWDPVNRQKIFEMVPAPNEKTIEALAVGRDGLVYGFAGATFFVFDPAHRKVLKAVPHKMSGIVFSALEQGPGEELYGLSTNAIFRIDTKKRRPQIVVSYPEGISGGFAIQDRKIFFTSGTRIVSYTLP